MNNYYNTEKSLKRWLKSRVKITMATVVGFLITGSMAFGAIIVYDGNEKNPDISNGLTQSIFEGAKGGLKTGKNGKSLIRINTNGTENNELEISGIFTGTGKDNYLITANTTKKAEITIKEGTVLTYNNTILNLQGTGEYINNGTLTKTGGINAAVIINGKTGEMSFTNNGKIEVLGGIKTAIDLTPAQDQEAITFNNSGTIIGNITKGGKGNININLTEGSHIEGKIAFNYQGTDMINITNVTGENGEAEELQSITGADKINISKSNITFADGKMEKVITNEDKFLIDITDSNVINKMDLISKADSIGTIGKTNLINSYGKTAGNYTLINDGELTSNNAASGIYTNAKAEKVVMNVINNGKVNIESAEWATGLNGKFDSEIKGAEISITNNGNITVKNGAGMDITNAGEESNKGILTNSENGIITTSGFSVGMLVDGKGMSAVNNGTIIINEGTKHEDGRLSYGMQAKNDASVTNNGTIILEYDDRENVKAMGTAGEGSSGINNGKIKLSDITEIENVKEEDLIKQLLGEKIEQKGMIVNKLGVNIFADANLGAENDITGSEVSTGEIGKDGVADKVTVGTMGATLKGDDQSLQAESFNVSGEVKVEKGDSDAGVVIKDTTTNLDINGKFAVQKDTELKFDGGVVNGEETSDTVELAEGAKLALDGTVFNGNIAGNGQITLADATVSGNIAGKSLNVAGAEEIAVTTIDGEINVGTITVGEAGATAFALDRNDVGLDKEVKDILKLSSDSKFIHKNGTTLTINKEGAVVLGIGSETDKDGKYTENAFANSEVKVTVEGEGQIELDTSNISGTEATIKLGANHKFTNSNFVSDSDIYTTDGKVTDGDLTLKYNNELYKGDEVLSSIHEAASVLTGGVFAGTKEERAAQLDKIYSSNIYSETVRAAYDNVKLNEEALLTLGNNAEAGKWTAEGKALYGKTEYDREGTLGDYSSEIESTGLMAAFNYGLNETATMGIAFSGVKQDVDTDGGSADADLFYLGVYGNKVVGNYDFTAGLGYQFGEYDADNTVANIGGSDKYDSSAISGYIQGKYVADLGDGLSVQPKVKLGYTYIDQDDAKDSYFGVSDAEISTFDTEVGLDVVKSLQLEKSKLDVTFGASYVRTMGDTDDEFTGRFYGTDKVSNGFNVLGAELAENVVKFNLGAELTNENGFFYNGGFTYEFGSDNTDAYGVNVGVGYRF